MRKPLLCLGILLSVTSPTLAHNVGIDYAQEKGTATVKIEVFFDDDSPAVNVKVEVLDQDKKVVASGKTDAKGFWTFTAPAPGVFQVHANAGGAHLSDRKLTVDDWRGMPEQTADPPTPLPRDGLTRKEFTRFPWPALGIGLGVIFLFSVAFLIARRKASGS